MSTTIKPWLTVALLTILLAGCGADVSRTETPAEFFNRNQQGMMTPDGEFVPESAQDVGPNRIRYSTTNGTVIEITATPDGNGDYRYSDAELIVDGKSSTQ